MAANPQPRKEPAQPMTKQVSVDAGTRKTKVSFLSTGTGKQAGFDLAVIHAPKGTSWTPASIETQKMIVVITGTWRVLACGEETILRSNQVFRAPASKMHSWVALEDTVAIWIEQWPAKDFAAHEEQVNISGDPDQFLWGV
jgi:quercetin dioxygenase-like cupin family protein